MSESKMANIGGAGISLKAWRLEAGAGGLPRLTLDRDGIFAEIYLNGAHVTAFENRKRGLSMFRMDSAAPVSGRAIKGGIPLVFPWFGPLRDRPDFPRHGFARNIAWSVAGEFHKDGATGVALEASDSDLTRVVWPHAFKARVEASFGELEAFVAFIVTNTDKAPFQFENALHSYFSIGDVRAISVDGLDGAEYLDKIAGAKRKIQSGAVRLPSETDSVYVGVGGACLIREPGRAAIRIEKGGSSETVVWNPGPKKNDPAAVAPPFVCVEPANCVDHSITLAPGESHTLSARFIFEP